MHMHKHRRRCKYTYKYTRWNHAQKSERERDVFRCPSSAGRAASRTVRGGDYAARAAGLAGFGRLPRNAVVRLRAHHVNAHHRRQYRLQSACATRRQRLSREMHKRDSAHTLPLHPRVHFDTHTNLISPTQARRKKIMFSRERLGCQKSSLSPCSTIRVTESNERDTHF